MKMFYLDTICLNATGYKPTEKDLLACIMATNEEYLVEDALEFFIWCKNKPFNNMAKGIVWKEKMNC